MVMKKIEHPKKRPKKIVKVYDIYENLQKCTLTSMGDSQNYQAREISTIIISLKY